MTFAEISSSTVFDRSNVSGPSSLQVWFFDEPSEDLHHRTGRGGVRQVVVFGSTAPDTSGTPGIGVFLHGGANALAVRVLVDVGEAHLLHGVEVIEVAPELLEAVRGRQCVGVIAQVVLAELAGVVAKINQELGERRGAGPQIRRAAGKLWRDHARAQRIHAGEEGVAPRGAALLGEVSHELGALLGKAVNVGGFTEPQTVVVDFHLHPADVIAHDEQDVGSALLRRLLLLELWLLPLLLRSLRLLSHRIACQSERYERSSCQ